MIIVNFELDSHSDPLEFLIVITKTNQMVFKHVKYYPTPRQPDQVFRPGRPASSSPLVNCLRIAWQKELGLGLANTVKTLIGASLGSPEVLFVARTPRLSQEQCSESGA